MAGRVQQRVMLVKVVVQVVTAVAAGDRVQGENEGPRIACYTPEQLAEVWAKAEAEVAEQNAELRPARSRRRSQPKGGKS